MDITITGTNIDTGEALRNYVADKLNGGVSKYLDRATDANVVFAKEAHFFTASIILNSGTKSNIVIKGSDKSDNAHSAFDAAFNRVEKQLRRYKRKINDHYKDDIENIPKYAITKYILQADSHEAVDDSVDNTEDNPIVIAEKPSVIENLTVSEAVMRMDLGDLPALAFINRATGDINFVYKRKDGNISWIDPTRK